MTWAQRKQNALRQCVGLRIAAAGRVGKADGQQLLVQAARDLEVLKVAWIVSDAEYTRIRHGWMVAWRRLKR